MMNNNYNMENDLDTPVVFIIYNRPEQTKIVFDALRKVKPRKLFVVADGPRSQFESQKCEETRSILKTIDWGCEVFENFSDYNLGCGKRISSGLDWVFSKAEEAIILEDDCLPSPSFFYFCQTLLEKYHKNEGIMQISGNNFQPESNVGNYSYYFSKYPHIWGWATWKRAWDFYDFSMKSWPEFKKSRKINALSENIQEKIYWTAVFDRRYYRQQPDTWDYQWVYACWLQGGLSINPSRNLVSNIGAGKDASHTKKKHCSLLNIPTQDIWQITHPPIIASDHKIDAYTARYVYGITGLRCLIQCLKP